MNNLPVNASSVVRALGTVAALLLLASIAGQVSKYFLGHGSLKGLVALFFVDSERNVPTFFSTLLLLTSGLLLAMIARLKMIQADSAKPWGYLSGGFFLMAFDEAFELHESLTDPFRDLLGEASEGFLYFAWVLPGVVFVLALGALFYRFLAGLPALTRNRFLLAGACFLAGIIGMEMLGGRHAFLYGYENFAYSMIATVEEGLEMAGLILFIRALLLYCAEHHAELYVEISA